MPVRAASASSKRFFTGLQMADNAVDRVWDTMPYNDPYDTQDGERFLVSCREVELIRKGGPNAS